MQVSICIPTFNRAGHLKNCLNSIALCERPLGIDFEVCISDNCSTDSTEAVVQHAQSTISSVSIKYHKNLENLGIPRNFLKVVSMAEGEFSWLIGDDDLLMPDAITRLALLISEHPAVDFFYVNSFHLRADFLEKYPSPFDTENLPKNMVRFSKWRTEGELPFFSLIDPKISFDFLGGMFLSVFRTRMWRESAHVLDTQAVADNRTFSHFDNTFPHVKIFAHAFSGSTACFNARPLNVCLTGVREWSPMYPFIHSVRLVEALEEYRRNGLSYLRYIRCRNYALNNFLPDFVNMFLAKDISGYRYISPLKLMLKNCLYPNFYLSLFYFVERRMRRFFGQAA